MARQWSHQTHQADNHVRFATLARIGQTRFRRVWGLRRCGCYGHAGKPSSSCVFRAVTNYRFHVGRYLLLYKNGVPKSEPHLKESSGLRYYAWQVHLSSDRYIATWLVRLDRNGLVVRPFVVGSDSSQFWGPPGVRVWDRPT